jgi:hypothetical protein
MLIYHIKLPQKSVIERQLFIKYLSFPSFGRQVLNTFYIMYIVKLVKHVSLRYIGVCVRFHPHFMDKYEEVDISAFINVS